MPSSTFGEDSVLISECPETIRSQREGSFDAFPQYVQLDRTMQFHGQGFLVLGVLNHGGPRFNTTVIRKIVLAFAKQCLSFRRPQYY
jgi:hypothetical protein